MRSIRRFRGFTLTEILIVLGIIALLTAILLPVLSRVRENGRKVACASNLQQLGMAFQQYTNDWNRRYPLAGLYIAFANQPVGWEPPTANWIAGTKEQPLACVDPLTGCGTEGDYIPGHEANIESGALYSYVKNTQIYICPSNPDGRKKKVSYSMNCALAELSSVKIRQPAEIVLLVDELEANDGFFFAVDDGASNPAGSYLGNSPTSVGTATTNSSDKLVEYHNGGGNLLFADGHVKFYPFEKFPLDGTAEGKANKWRWEGVPRFHDKAFGTWGSYRKSGATTDSCNATQR